MCMYAQGQPPNKLLTFGMMALVVANVGSYVIHRKLAVPESLADPVSGFLFGIAIAATLIGVRRQARARRSVDPRQ
jgi:hypothetical protein